MIFLDENLWVDVALFFSILVISFIVAKTLNFFLVKIAEKVVLRTKTKLDNIVLHNLELPLLLILMFSSIYVAAYVSGFSETPVFILLAKEFLIAFGAFFVYRLGTALLKWYATEAAPAGHLPLVELIELIKRLLALVLFSIAAIMMLDTAGIQVSPLVASLGIAGLAVALAFQDTLGNFFAGVYLSVDRPVKEGDYVQLENGQEGYVHKIGWRSTQIKMLSNNIIVIPNSKLASSIIVNYYAPDKSMAVVVPISVAYGSSLDYVEILTVQVAEKIQKTIAGADATFKPFVRFGSFGESGIMFSVILRVKEYVDKYLVTHEFIKQLHVAYAKNGIEIPYPHRHVYIEQAKKRRKK